MGTTHTPFQKGILLYLIFVAVCMTAPEGIGPSKVWAFRFISPSSGEIVEAGNSLKIRIDPGDKAPLFGVLLMVSRGVSPSKLDSMPPYEWSIQIPKTFIGPLTFWAVARRYTPVPNPPRAAVTIKVIHAINHAAQPDLPWWGSIRQARSAWSFFDRHSKSRAEGALQYKKDVPAWGNRSGTGRGVRRDLSVATACWHVKRHHVDLILLRRSDRGERR